MNRFKAAWQAFKNAWKHWTPENPLFLVIWSKERLTADREEDILLICNGEAHARRLPKRKGDRGMMLVKGVQE